MNKEVNVSPLMRVKKRLIGLQSLIDDSFEFGLISKEDWQSYRQMIDEIRTIRIERILKKAKENGNKASN